MKSIFRRSKTSTKKTAAAIPGEYDDPDQVQSDIQAIVMVGPKVRKIIELAEQRPSMLSDDFARALTDVDAALEGRDAIRQRIAMRKAAKVLAACREKGTGWCKENWETLD